MNEQNLKRALWLAVALCLLLASALTYAVMHREGQVRAQNDAEPVVAAGPVAAANPAVKPVQANADEAPLAPLQLSPQRLQEIGVTTAIVEMKSANDALQAPGTVAMDERRLAYVQTRFPGWIKDVFVNATYQYVRKGQRLFTVYSPDLVSTEQEYLLAKQNQKATIDHMHGTAASESNWLLDAAAERLRRFDIPNAEIAALEQSGKVQREVAIESPAAGYILERNALPNAYVQPDTKLYTIADLSTVWVYANVFQTDVGRLKPGDRAHVSVDAYPGRTFSGQIDQILPEVDATTRTVKVRLAFSNPGLALKPGMYVNVDIAAPLGKQLMIPASGVLQAGTRQIAFLDHGQGSLEPREISTGTRINDSVAVLKGLKAGDRIVSSANFLLDSEAQLQGAMAAFNPPARPANNIKTETQQMRIDFTTDPAPPRRGTNTVRVQLTGGDGKSVEDATAKVTFFMPAMPAMSMAAMRVEANLTDKGRGAHEGSVQLGSGGTWNLTITVSRNGQVIGTRNMSVNAAGGM